MWGLLVIAVLGIVGYTALKKPKAKTEAIAPHPVLLPTVSEVAESIAKNMTSISIGDVFIHKETGEKVRIVGIEPNVDGGEYIIQWSSGATGKIHKASLASQFTKV